MYKWCLRVLTSLCLCLIFIFALVPCASALETIGIDLLQFAAFAWYEDGDLVANTEAPYRDAVDVTSYAVAWSAGGYASYYDHVYVVIETDSLPSSVVFTPEPGVNISGSISGIYRGYAYYRFSLDSQYNLSVPTLTVNYSSPYTGTFGIVGCTAYKDVYYDIPSVDVVGVAEQIGSVTVDQTVFKTQTSASLPVTTYYSNSTDSSILFDKMGVEHNILQSSIRIKNVSTFLANLDYIGYSANFGLFVENMDGDVTEVPLTVTVGRIGSTQVTDNLELPRTYVTISADMASYDLYGCEMYLYVDVDASFASGSTAYASCTLYDITLDAVVHTPSFLENAFDWIGGKLDKLYNALVGSSDAGSSDFVDDAQNMSGSLSSAVDSMNNLQKPNVGALSGDIDAYVSPTGMQMLALPFMGLFANDIFANLLMVALVLCLGSYVLFGRK